MRHVPDLDPANAVAGAPRAHELPDVSGFAVQLVPVSRQQIVEGWFGRSWRCFLPLVTQNGVIAKSQPSAHNAIHRSLINRAVFHF
jgi:hypothetical protein